MICIKRKTNKVDGINKQILQSGLNGKQVIDKI